MSTPVQKLFDLSGRTALVTGGSRGLGLQIAEALGEAGAQILLTSRKAADLEESAAHLKAKGIEALWIAADASRPDEVQRVAADAMARLGKVDILVNNAGATWGAPAEDYPLEAWDKVMNLNIRSVFLMSQAVGKASMIPNGGGRIINIASIAGLSGSGPEIKFIAYGTSKGAVVNFTRTLAGEWGQLRHHRQRARAGLLPEQDDQGRARDARRRQPGRARAAAPPRRRRRPQGRGAAVRVGRGQAHHRPDPRRRRWGECGAWRVSSR